MPASDTSMKVTSVRAGFIFNAGVAGAAGTMPIGQSLSGQIGFDLNTMGSGGNTQTLLVSARNDVADPPTLAISVDYDQREEFYAIEFDVGYNDIPEETWLQVLCGHPSFSIAKQRIEGSSSVRRSADRVNPFSSTIELLIWVPKLQDIRPTSSVTLGMSQVDTSAARPKKVLLQKFVLMFQA